MQTFQQPRYTENFVQSIIDIALKGQCTPGQVTLVVGGDGRYHSKVAIDAIVSIAAANGVSFVSIVRIFDSFFSLILSHLLIQTLSF